MAIYLLIDGDDVGSKIAKCYLENDELTLARTVKRLPTRPAFTRICVTCSGIIKIFNPGFFDEFRQEMQTVFNKKHELGLIDNQKPIVSFSEELPDFILIIANHDPASRVFI